MWTVNIYSGGDVTQGLQFKDILKNGLDESTIYDAWKRSGYQTIEEYIQSLDEWDAAELQERIHTRMEHIQDCMERLKYMYTDLERYVR